MAQCPSCGSEKVGVAKMEQGFQITCPCGYAGNLPSLPRELKKAALKSKSDKTESEKDQ